MGGGRSGTRKTVRLDPPIIVHFRPVWARSGRPSVLPDARASVRSEICTIDLLDLQVHVAVSPPISGSAEEVAGTLSLLNRATTAATAQSQAARANVAAATPPGGSPPAATTGGRRHRFKNADIRRLFRPRLGRQALALGAAPSDTFLQAPLRPPVSANHRYRTERYLAMPVVRYYWWS